VLAAGSKVKGVEVPPADNASTAYPIATVKASTKAACSVRAVPGRPERARRGRLPEAVTGDAVAGQAVDGPGNPAGAGRRRADPIGILLGAPAAVRC